MFGRVVCVVVLGVSLWWGCSGDDPLSRGGGDGDGTGGGTGTGGGSGTGGLLGTGAMTVTGTGGMVVPPVFNSNAPSFTRDDTGMSGLDAGTIDTLRNGTPAGSCSIVYPYEGTKFPGNLPAPLLMWTGASDAAYVHIDYAHEDRVDYEFAQATSNPGQLRVPQDAWTEIVSRTTGAQLHVLLRTMSGGALQECETYVTIAPGNMVGAIYYNTYNAPGVMVPGNGAVMRLRLGETQSDIYLQYDQPGAAPVTGPCVSCHSVSVGGSTIVASTHNYFPLLQSFDVSSYLLRDAAQPPAQAMVDNANFGALTPDGSRILTMGNPDCTAGSDTFPRTPNNFPLVEGPAVARLLDTASGNEIAAKGLDPQHYMWMPQFSPTGDMVAFNHAKPDGAGGTDRRELAIATYDQATNTFGTPEVIVSNLGPAPSLPYTATPSGSTPLSTGYEGCMEVTPAATGNLNPGMCDEPCYPAFPFFTPDGRFVIFSMINSPDFTTAFPGRDQPAKSELWFFDMKTRELGPLTNANTTLDPNEAQLDHYPTVLPVQVGGYFWVFWTSRRAWGHQDTGGMGVQQGVLDPLRKRIWAAAIQPRRETEEFGEPTGDPSFPGFYLEGQSESGNVRAFAALNPCKENGNDCTSGLDCCGGFCKFEEGETVGVCNDEAECAMTNERCDTDDDCCPPTAPDEPQNVCLGGYCGFVVLQ